MDQEQKEIQNEFEKYSQLDLGKDMSGAENVTGLTPHILEERHMNVTQMDVFSRLMKDRIIFLGMPINDQVADVVVAQLLFLANQDSSEDINIYVNSPGGTVYSGLGIYDTMRHIGCDVGTTCVGMAASMGAVLLAGGEKGKRSALPHSRVMIHQPLGGAQGQATDIEITAKEIMKLKEELVDILAHRTEQDYNKVYEDAERDFWLRSHEAKEYGLIDEVALPQKESNK